MEAPAHSSTFRLDENTFGFIDDIGSRIELKMNVWNLLPHAVHSQSPICQCSFGTLRAVPSGLNPPFMFTVRPWLSVLELPVPMGFHPPCSSKLDPSGGALPGRRACNHGRSLAHFSAQRKHSLWVRECIGGELGVFSGYLEGI